MHTVHRLPRGEIHHARAEQVYPLLEPDSVSLVISDGPYGMRKAEWDKMGVDGLADWYAPHVEAWGRVCAPSATVYLWNTAEGWARLDPVMRAAGWTFQALVTWDKTSTQALKGAEVARGWPDVTEVCGMYQREAWAPGTCAGQEIAYAAGRDERNWVRLWLREEWEVAGLTVKDADRACGVACMASRHYFPADQWWLPTWEHFQTMAAYAAKNGRARERPYLVHPSCWHEPEPLSATYDHLRAEYDHLRAEYDHLRAEYDHLRAEYDHLRAEYDHLRAEYEASRPAFNCPMGVGNVWRHGQVSGSERLRGADGASLHPCQKPLAFYRRIIRASSRPGELVLEPFGGTCRTAAAAEEMLPGEQRRYVCVEPDEDGRDYLPAVLKDIRHRIQAMALTLRCDPVEVEPIRSAEQVALWGAK